MKRIAAALALTIFALTGCTTTPVADELPHGGDALKHVAPPEGVDVLDSIDGVWVSAAEPGAATLLLADDEWTWNGCHDSGGTFEYTERGRTLVYGGWNGGDYMFCGGDPLGSWFEAAVTAGFINGELVLFDAYDKEIGRLARA